MNCPKCGAKTNIIDTRPSEKYGRSLRRRRMCWKCRYRFSTYELTGNDLDKFKKAKELLLDISRYVKEDKT